MAPLGFSLLFEMRNCLWGSKKACTQPLQRVEYHHQRNDAQEREYFSAIYIRLRNLAYGVKAGMNLSGGSGHHRSFTGKWAVEAMFEFEDEEHQRNYWHCRHSTEVEFHGFIVIKSSILLLNELWDKHWLSMAIRWFTLFVKSIEVGKLHRLSLQVFFAAEYTEYVTRITRRLLVFCRSGFVIESDLPLSSVVKFRLFRCKSYSIYTMLLRFTHDLDWWSLLEWCDGHTWWRVPQFIPEI